MANLLGRLKASFYPRSLHRRIQLWYGGLIVLSFTLFIGFSLTLIDTKASYESKIYMHESAKSLTQNWRRIKRLNKNSAAEIQGSDAHQRLLRNKKRFQNITARMLGRNYYYGIYNKHGELEKASDSFPENTPLPTIKRLPHHSTYQYRNRGNYSEITYRYDGDNGIVIGRDTSIDKVLLQKAAAPLLGLAILVMGVTLLGGWIIVRKSLRPLHLIHESTEQIARGNLHARIPDYGMPSELAPLVTELNRTFANLETAIEKQQRLAANASHELATPTAALLAELESILRKDRSAPEYKESIEHCLLAANRLTDLLKHLTTLNIAQETESSVEPIALKPCIQQLCNLIKPLADKKQIALAYLLDNSVVNAPRVLLEQAISSLLANAVAYTPNGGDITVTLKSLGADMRLTITDTGIGIASEDLPHIFERYYRADKAHTSSEYDGGQHSGLGLSIVREVVESNGGKVEVTSVLGKGTTFSIWLPQEWSGDITSNPNQKEQQPPKAVAAESQGKHAISSE